MTRDLRQVGPTLFWQALLPQVGAQFQTVGATYEIMTVTPDKASGGFLFTAEPVRATEGARS